MQSFSPHTRRAVVALAALGAVILLTLGFTRWAVDRGWGTAHAAEAAASTHGQMGYSTAESASLTRLFGFLNPSLWFHASSAVQQARGSGVPASQAETPAVAQQGAISGTDGAGAPFHAFHVGIQAGHWLNSQLPPELAALKGSTGAAGNGWKEVDVNLDIARRVVALLQKDGVQADLLPATVPADYQADAFVALHGDVSSSTAASGYKLARSDWSQIPGKDDALLSDVSTAYQAATGLKNDPGTITYAMRRYYVFNNRRYDHAVAPTTPSVILEMGFLSSPKDRDFLVNHPDTAAEAIAKGILVFLNSQR